MELTTRDVRFFDGLVQCLAENQDTPSRDRLERALNIYRTNNYDTHHYDLSLCQYDCNTDHLMIVREHPDSRHYDTPQHL